MKLITLALLLVGLCAPAFSCDFTAGPGAAMRLTEGKSGGLATMGCIFDEKWEVRLYFFGEQRIYEEQILIKPYVSVSASRLWMFRDGRRVRPILGAGVMFKQAERCHYDGDLHCNRLTPLPFCFMASAGLKIGDVMITLNHCSNASLDFGPEKKNLGQDFIRAEVVF